MKTKKIIKKKVHQINESNSENESNSDNESDFEFEILQLDKEKLQIVPEYKYRLNDLIDPDAKTCLMCDKKMQSRKHDLAVCRKCFRLISINKTRAKKIYNLTDDDLNELKCFEYKIHYYIIYLYLLVEVRLLAIEKKFNIYDPNLDKYILCVNVINEENDQIAKMKDEKKQLREKMRAKQKKIIDTKLNKKNIKVNTYQQRNYYDKYIQNPKASLKNTIANIEAIQIEEQQKKERETKLNNEMKKYHYDIFKSEDPYIDDYIIDHEFSLKKCVRLLLRERKKFDA